MCALFSSVANIILLGFTVWYFKEVILYVCHSDHAWSVVLSDECPFSFCCTWFKYCSLYCK